MKSLRRLVVRPWRALGVAWDRAASRWMTDRLAGFTAAMLPVSGGYVSYGVVESVTVYRWWRVALGVRPFDSLEPGLRVYRLSACAVKAPAGTVVCFDALTGAS